MLSSTASHDDAEREFGPADYARAVLNILDDASVEEARRHDTQQAVVNVLEDSADERARLEVTQKAVLNILEDSGSEQLRLAEFRKAVLNVLDDLAEEMDERTHLEERFRTRTREIERHMRASLQEKEVLLQEIHHRVKNNLQIIASLLSLQSGYIRDPQMLMQFEESQGRIRSMALIHEKLYQSESLATVDLADYVRTLVTQLMRTYTWNDNVTLELRLEPAAVSIDTAVPVGLLLNELVTNALKYAYPDARRGYLRLSLLAESSGHFNLRVEDDGVGLNPDFQLEQATTLGLRLVTMFTKQLRADVKLHSEPGSTAFDIRFREAAFDSPVE